MNFPLTRLSTVVSLNISYPVK